MGWRTSIVRYGEEAPDQILAHCQNVRLHTRAQEEALLAILNKCGIIQNVVINLRTGADWPDGERGVQTLLDGHLRVQAAISEGQDKLPVTYVDLNPEQERTALAAFDAVGAMAATDKEKLAALLEQTPMEDPNLKRMMEALKEFKPLGDEWKGGAAGGDEGGAGGGPKKLSFKLQEDQLEEVEAALTRSKQAGHHESAVNDDQNANALAFICRFFLEKFNPPPPE